MSRRLSAHERPAATAGSAAISPAERLRLGRDPAQRPRGRRGSGRRRATTPPRSRGRLRGARAGYARSRRRRRPLLPVRPVKREIIEIVAEIGPGRTRGARRQVLRPQMPGELAVEMAVSRRASPEIEDRALVEASRRAHPLGSRSVVRRALDAEAFGASAQAEMQDEARPMVLKQARAQALATSVHSVGSTSVWSVQPERRLRVAASASSEPGRGILGGAGKRAEPGDEDARASHDVSGLTRLTHRREAQFRGARG